MSVSKDVVARLVTEGVGTEDSSLFAHPVEPGNQQSITIPSVWAFSDNSVPPERYLSSGRVVDWRHSVTVRIRAHQSKFHDGEAKSQEVMDVLEQANITGYYSVTIQEPYRNVGKDGLGNHEWELKVLLQTKEIL